MECVFVLFLLVGSLCASVQADQIQELRNSVQALQLQCESWREDDRHIILDLQQHITDVRQQNVNMKREVSDVKRQNEILLKKFHHLSEMYENLQIKYNTQSEPDAENVTPLGKDLRKRYNHYTPSYSLHDLLAVNALSTQTPDVSTPAQPHHWLNFGSQVTTPAYQWIGFGNQPQGPIGLAGSTGSLLIPASTGLVGSTASTASTGQLESTASTKHQGSAGSSSKLGSTGSKGQQGILGSTETQGQNLFLSQNGVGSCLCQKGDVGPVGTQGIKGPSGLKGDIGHDGPQGPKGDTGRPGSKGEPGLIGIQGPKGDAATMSTRGGVAFYATITNTISVRMGMTLKYEHVLTNEGHRYDPHSGVFTCDESGVYVFSWSTGVGKSDHVSTELAKNGQIVNMQITTGADQHEQSTSHTAVLSLQDNDRVQVLVYRIVPGRSSYVLGDASSFSGFLLFKF